MLLCAGAVVIGARCMRTREAVMSAPLYCCLRLRACFVVRVSARVFVIARFDSLFFVYVICVFSFWCVFLFCYGCLNRVPLRDAPAVC